MREFWSDLKRKISEYFVHTSGERRATVLLIAIILLLSASIVFVNFMPKEKTDFTEFENAIAQLKPANESNTENKKETFRYKDSTVSSQPVSEKTEIQLFAFDPNNLPPDDWKKLGLSDKQIRVIKNYESHGGHFYKKEDLKKIYSISAEIYSRLEPYIEIKNTRHTTTLKFDSTNNASKNPDIKNKIPPPVLDINTATQEQLESLQGIGKWIAVNIIKYREKLGGYYSKEQLLEVKYITDSVYNIILPQIKVNDIYINKINLNSATLGSIKHPYFDFHTQKLIVAYRSQHGNFQSVDEISVLRFIEAQTFRKLKPYLSVEEP